MSNKNKNVKRMVREMMEVTGRSYASCLQQLLTDGEIIRFTRTDGTLGYRVPKEDDQSAST